MHSLQNELVNNFFHFQWIKSIFLVEEMDTADEELRETIRIIWPLHERKMTDLLVPRKEMLNKNNLTVGKIYGGLMILESWRNTRFGKKKNRFNVSRQSRTSFYCHASRMFCMKFIDVTNYAFQIESCIKCYLHLISLHLAHRSNIEK